MDYISLLLIFVFLYINISATETVKIRDLKKKRTVTESYDIQGRIIGGEPVPLENYPFQVQIFNMGALCSGTVINSWTVLTSAHCFDKNNDTAEIMIQAGSRHVYDFNAKVYQVTKFVIHEGYSSSMQFENDIALIFVETPILLGNTTQKAILVNTDKWMNKKETNFIVTGWGWTQYGGKISELGLMMTHLQYIPATECNRMHKMKLTRDMFCLYGGGDRDTCKGDSGGGVLWNGMIVGITSHGDGCAKKDKPSVYTNVYYFRDWIKEQVYNFFELYCRSKMVNI